MNVKNKKVNGRGRTRNFATIVYPESAPDDWVDLLKEQKVPSIISPLHDLDVNPTGEIKKPHWHVMLLFDSVKTIEQATEMTLKFGGVGCEKIESLRGYARYLCHLDNPEKVQYEIDEVTCLFGADYLNIIGNPSDKYKAIQEMTNFINEENLIHYVDLFEYASIHRKDWFKVLCDNGTYVIKEYLRSKEYKQRIDELD